jgi:hypothetical protein
VYEGESTAVLVVFVVVFWIIPIFVAANIWTNKGGSSGAGAALGIFLGWIGVLIAAVVTPSNPSAQRTQGGIRTHRECPHCKEPMRRDASVCPHCQRESKAWKLHEGRWWVLGDDGNDYYLDEMRNEWKSVAPSPPPSP